MSTTSTFSARTGTLHALASGLRAGPVDIVTSNAGAQARIQVDDAFHDSLTVSIYRQICGPKDLYELAAALKKAARVLRDMNAASRPALPPAPAPRVLPVTVYSPDDLELTLADPGPAKLEETPAVPYKSPDYLLNSPGNPEHPCTDTPSLCY